MVHVLLALTSTDRNWRMMALDAATTLQPLTSHELLFITTTGERLMMSALYLLDVKVLLTQFQLLSATILTEEL